MSLLLDTCALLFFALQTGRAPSVLAGMSR